MIITLNNDNSNGSDNYNDNDITDSNDDSSIYFSTERSDIQEKKVERIRKDLFKYCHLKIINDARSTTPTIFRIIFFSFFRHSFDYSKIWLKI